GLARINAGKFALVLNIYEDDSLPVRSGEFRFAVQGDGAHNLVISSINHRGILTASIESENAFGGGIVKDRVRVFAAFGLDPGCFFEGLEIKHRDAVFAAIAGKSFSQVLGQRDPMNARSVGDITNHASLFRIN